MTVASLDVLAQATGTGATATYAFSAKKLLAVTDLVVTIRVIATGTATVQTLNGVGTYDYTATVASDFSGGTVVLNNILPNTHEITVERVMDLVQPTAFTASTLFPAAVVERAFDKLVLLIQQVEAKLNRKIGFSSDANDIGTIEFNQSVTNRALKLFSFDAAGEISLTQEIGVYTGNWSTATNYVVRDLIKDTSNNNIYICLTAHTSSGSQPISSNTDVAKWGLIVDASSASTSASAASASAAAALLSENNASTSETSAASSAASAAAYASTGVYYVATGSSNAYVITQAVSPGAYSAGLSYLMNANHTNTGAVTLNVNGLGPKAVIKPNGNAFNADDITSGGIYHLTYDGTSFRAVGEIGGSSDQILINTLAIFTNTIEDMAAESEILRITVDGYTDDFQNGAVQASTAIDISDNSGNGITYDGTNDLWKNSPANTNSDLDKDYTTESNYLQQEWTNTLPATGQATVTLGDATVTLLSGSWPTNCAKGRISFDSGSTWYDIDARTDATNIELGVVATESTANYDYVIRMSEFDSGEVKLNSDGSDVINEQDTTTITATANVKGNSTNNLYHATQFKATSGDPITRIALQLKLQNSPTDSVSVEIYSSTTPTASLGDPNASLATSSNTIPYSDLNSSTYTEVNFNIDYTPTLNNYYFIVLKRVADDTTNYYLWGGVTSGSSYAHAYGLTFQSSAWNGTSQTECNFKITQSTGSNLVSEYVSICDTELKKTDTSHWTDINSGSVTETLNSQNIYYSIAFDPVSSFGNGTEIKIFNQTGSAWRVIAKNNSGTWEYNNDSGNSATYSGVSATVNDMLHAVSQAISTQSGNRMTGAELAAITDGEWEAANGWSASVDSIIRLATLYSNSSSQNPSLSQFRINYDNDSFNGLLTNQNFGSTGMPVVPASDVSSLILMVIDKHIVGTPTYEVSANGGTDWTTVSSWDEESTITNSYVSRIVEVSVTSHTSPRTSPKFRIRNGGTGRSYELKAHGFQYK